MTSSPGTTSAAPPSASATAADTDSFIGEVDGKPVKWPGGAPFTVRLTGPAPNGAPALPVKAIANLRASASRPR